MRIAISGIYKITSPIGHIYIGRSTDIYKRLRCYENKNCKRQQRLYNSIIKYGWSKHLIEIIHECDPFELDSWECFYIDKFKTYNTDHGLNLRSGGQKGSLISNETRRRISESAKKRKYSLEGRAKLKLRTGRIHSEATKNKMSKAQKKRVNRITKKSRQIFQYDKSGKLINIWDSASHVARGLNKFSANVHKAIKTNKIAWGFIWKAA